jgi:DNA-binding IclR family transcriptional regulator
MKSDGVQVLIKASVIMNLLAQQGELSAQQLADLSGEPRTSIYRLLGSLQQLELVEPGRRRGTYMLGIRLFRLGSAVASRFDVRQAALPGLERLHEATGETVFLCIRRNYEAICIERISGRWVEAMTLRLGGALPLYISAASHALLAAEPQDFWREYLEHENLVPFTAHTTVEIPDLLATLENTRNRGYSVSNEDIVLGMAALGAPVFNHEGSPCAAVSIGGPVATILGDNLNRNIGHLTAASASASRALGFAGWSELVRGIPPAADASGTQVGADSATLGTTRRGQVN